MSSDSVRSVPSGKSYFGATVLVCKLELGVFQEAVHEDDEFAQTGHQRHFGLLACLRQLVVLMNRLLKNPQFQLAH